LNVIGSEIKIAEYIFPSAFLD